MLVAAPEMVDGQRAGYAATVSSPTRSVPRGDAIRTVIGARAVTRPRRGSPRPRVLSRSRRHGAVAGLDRQVEPHALERDAGEIAAVLDVDDVGAQPADDLRDRRRARRAGRAARSAAARAARSAPARGGGRTTSMRASMLPPLSTTADVRSRNVAGYSSSAASPAAPAPSRIVFSISTPSAIASSMRCSDTTTMSSTSSATMPRVSAPGSATAMPSAIVGPPSAPAARPERVQHARVSLDLHADDAHVGPQRLHRDRDARDQSAAADRHDDRVDRSVGLREQLEPDRALARDDVRVVERGNERRAGLVRDAFRLRERARVADPSSTTCAPWCAVFETFVNGVSAGITIVAGMPRRRAWYATPCAWLPADAATTPRRVGASGELREEVAGAALLERTGELEVLELQPDLGAGDGGQRVRAGGGGLADRAPDRRRPRPGRRRASRAGLIGASSRSPGRGPAGRALRRRRALPPRIMIVIIARWPPLHDIVDPRAPARRGGRGLRRAGLRGRPPAGHRPGRRPHHRRRLRQLPRQGRAAVRRDRRPRRRGDGRAARRGAGPRAPRAPRDARRPAGADRGASRRCLIDAIAAARRDDALAGAFRDRLGAARACARRHRRARQARRHDRSRARLRRVRALRAHARDGRARVAHARHRRAGRRGLARTDRASARRRLGGAIRHDHRHHCRLDPLDTPSDRRQARPDPRGQRRHRHDLHVGLRAQPRAAHEALREGEDVAVERVDRPRLVDRRRSREGRRRARSGRHRRASRRSPRPRARR